MADTLATPFTAAWSEVDRVAPAVTAHPRVTIAATALAVAGGFAYYSRSALLRAAFWLCVLASFAVKVPMVALASATTKLLIHLHGGCSSCGSALL